MNRASRISLLTLAAAGIAAGLWSCVGYNEDCTPLVDNPDQVVGYLGGEVDLSKHGVRAGDNAIGQLVADAYRHSRDGQSGGGGAPEIGIENAGSVRNEGICQSHDTLPRGKVLRKTLREVLPFDDTVSVVSINVATLKQVLEHAVAGFAASTDGGVAATPAGSFLQISGMNVTVDCARPGESTGVSGSRIQEIALEDALPDGGVAPGEVIYSGGAPSTSRYVRVACNSFVLQGGDGYTMLQNLDPASAQRFDEQGLNFQIVAEYFQKTSPDAPHARSATPLPRWLFTNCAR